jgi:predicted membrane channel-forming protein YqfA (hemolysin III family)
MGLIFALFELIFLLPYFFLGKHKDTKTQRKGVSFFLLPSSLILLPSSFFLLPSI